MIASMLPAEPACILLPETTCGESALVRAVAGTAVTRLNTTAVANKSANLRVIGRPRPIRSPRPTIIDPPSQPVLRHRSGDDGARPVRPANRTRRRLAHQ